MATAWMTRFGLRVALVLCLAVSFHGCGGDEPETPGVAEDSAPAEGRVAPTPSTPNVSPTATLLQYAPADPAVTMVIPSVTSLETHIVDFSKRLAESPSDVDAAIASWSANLAMQLGIESGDTPSQVLANLGLDPAAAMALYVDMEAFNERVMAEVQRQKAEMESAESEMMAEPSPDGEEGVADDTMEMEAPAEEGVDIDFEMDDTMDEGTDGMSIEAMPPMVDPFEAAGLPAMVGAFTVTDASKAVAQLDAALQKSPMAASFSKQEQESNGVTITVYDPNYCSYFVQNNVLFVGNELAWLEKVAARVQSPGTVAETTFDGTVDDEQLIAEFRLDRLEPFLEAMNVANSMMPGQAGMMASAQANSWDEMKAAYAGTDPVVATLEWDDRGVSLDTRLNLDEHPAMKEMTGSSGPMRLATVLPESTQAMIGIRFTPEMKNAIRKFWIDAFPPDALQDPSMAGMVMGANQAIESIDDEIVVALTGVAGGMPTGLAMIGLTNPEAVLQQYGMFLMMAGASMPEMPSEPGAIQELTFGGAMTVYYTVVNNALMVASLREELEGAVENVKASSASGYFTSLDPAMDPKQERFFALSLKPEAVNAVSALQGGMTADPAMEKILSTLEEVRFVQEMHGPWLVQDIDVYLTAP